ncbi:MAG: addiction module toxin RelE [Cellvibrionaceae bacterium]|nr:addiction module toxin RelE [Cellvibrionaceae bacterium]|tara:strand:+ start:183 stop:521 length:339 start_codon:yes stop_codon:yes gene_type:complete
MPEEQSETARAEIQVFQTTRFEKALKKLPDASQMVVEDAIDEILLNPELGELKAGDLDHLRVHKLKVNSIQYLLGYNWNEDRLVIHLLQLGTHENYYQNARSRRKADIKYIG